MASVSLSTIISVSGLLTLYVLSRNVEFYLPHPVQWPLTNKGGNKSFPPLSKVRFSRTFNYLMKGTHCILTCLKLKITASTCAWWNTKYLNLEYSLAYGVEAVIFRVLQSCSNFVYNWWWRCEFRVQTSDMSSKKNAANRKFLTGILCNNNTK